MATEKPLTPLKVAMLNTIIRAFIKGLTNVDLRRELTRGLASEARSLRGVFTITKEVRRTKYKLQKLTKEEQKLKENNILRSLLQKTITKAQLNSIISSYYSVASKPNTINNQDTL